MISTIKRVGRCVEAKHTRLKIIKVATPNNGGNNRLNIAPNSYLFKSIDVANIHEVIALKKMSARCSSVGRLFIWSVHLTVCSYPKVAISKQFTVNQAETLIEAQSLI